MLVGILVAILILIGIIMFIGWITTATIKMFLAAPVAFIFVVIMLLIL